MNPRERLEAVLRAAIRAVDAGAAVERALPEALAGCEGPLVVLALGKAACGMAAAVERACGARVRAGLAVTKDGHAGASGWPLRETAHPVPDERCEQAAREALALAAATGPPDTLLVLLSGGASALVACPVAGIDRVALAETTRALLACGADIHETNCVRKHLTELSGGRLARAAGAGRIEVLAVSDVPGDALDAIGSGPCAPDPTRFADALAVVDRYHLRDRLPVAVRRHLEAGASGEREETPKPGEAIFGRVRHHVVASNRDAREAAEVEARRLGSQPVSLGDCLRGEAREQGRRLVERARADRGPQRRCLVAGGETTVTLRGGGRGGRSQELALAAALELARHPGDPIALLAAGTDGTDGPTDAAGAFVDAGTVARGRRAGVDAAAALADNDAHGFFAREGGLVVTGPTGTNVMDLVLVEA